MVLILFLKTTIITIYILIIGSPHASAIPLETPRKGQAKTPLRKSPLTNPRFYPAPEPNHAPPAGTPRKQKTRHSSNPPVEPHIGWLLDSRDHAVSESYNERLMVAPSSFSTSLGSTPQSLPKFEHPSHSLLKDNGFTQFVYHKYRLRCIKERRRLGLLSNNFVLVNIYFIFPCRYRPESRNDHLVSILVLFLARPL